MTAYIEPVWNDGDIPPWDEVDYGSPETGTDPDPKAEAAPEPEPSLEE